MNFQNKTQPAANGFGDSSNRGVLCRQVEWLLEGTGFC